jgi:8-oxo-dGTP diphosphatase
MTQLTEYVLGFLFSTDGRRVALIRKNRPEKLAGRLNGLGGKIEHAETAYDAMVREFEEESGIRVFEWRAVGALKDETKAIYIWAAFDDRLEEVRTTTDEEVTIACVTDALADSDLIPNLQVILPVAQRIRDIRDPVLFRPDLFDRKAA